jgi:hypothetical protein
LQRRGQDGALDGEDAARLTQGVLEIAGNARHRQHEQIAERVSREGRACAESVLEQLRHERLGGGQSDDVVAEIARRQDAVFAPQAS